MNDKVPNESREEQVDIEKLANARREQLGPQVAAMVLLELQKLNQDKKS